MNANRSKIGAILCTAILIASLALFIVFLILNKNGVLSDDQLTVSSSILSILVTTSVIVFALLSSHKSDSERYLELYRNDKSDKPAGK